MSRALLLVVALGALTMGCQAAYTDIRKVDDQTYAVTRVKQGFFRVKGSFFMCTPQGANGDLKCTEVDSN